MISSAGTKETDVNDRRPSSDETLPSVRDYSSDFDNRLFRLWSRGLYHRRRQHAQVKLSLSVSAASRIATLRGAAKRRKRNLRSQEKNRKNSGDVERISNIVRRTCLSFMSVAREENEKFWTSDADFILCTKTRVLGSVGIRLRNFFFVNFKTARDAS